MKLIVVHNHFRPGGVRRVIELATPGLARGLASVAEVVLASGEEPDGPWLRRFQAALDPLPVCCRTDPALLYLAEQRERGGHVTRRLRRFWDELLDAKNGLCRVWAHNQGLGRNLLLTRELRRACHRRGIPLVLHHHDWWFDNRWDRWPEMQRHGFRSLTQVAKVIFGADAGVWHLAINQADAAVLEKHFGKRAGWVPNPAEARPAVTEEASKRARRWLRRVLGEASAVWLMPCRLIRRKNIAEALLLTRWLRPEAWLVTTGGVSSAEEEAYAARLRREASQHGWRLRLGILHGSAQNSAPSVFELMSASEAVVLSSLQEGFGLPYLEAPAARRPLVARSLPNVMPDLVRFGFRFPQSYTEILVDPGLFDWREEVARQRRLYARWRQQLPGACRRLAGRPWILKHRQTPAPTPFSRLTLTAQLQVLKAPVDESWEKCAAINPFLSGWRTRAREGALEITPWPAQAQRWLSGPAYVRRFRSVLETAPGRPDPSADSACVAAQQDFIRQTLAPENLYPLSWNSRT